MVFPAINLIKPPGIGDFPYISPTFSQDLPMNTGPAQAPRVDHRRQLLRAGRGARLGEPLPGDHHRC